MLRQIIFLVIFVLILAIGGYFLYKNSDISAAPTEGTINEAKKIIEARLSDLRLLKDLSFDTSILQNRFFTSLQPPQPATPSEQRTGRPNPFLP